MIQTHERPRIVTLFKRSKLHQIRIKCVTLTVEESWGEMKLNELGRQKSEKQHFYQQVQKAKLMTEILQAR